MPEETLYLMERGSLFCWKECDIPMSLNEQLDSDFEDCDLTIGAPMSVQQAFTEMIGVDGLNLHHYLVSILVISPVLMVFPISVRCMPTSNA
jgi:tRNA-splicing endonuclease subunit Sen54